MRFENGNTVVEIGGAHADRIEASASVSFDWKPAAGDSYEWFRRDGSWDEESIASGSEPSNASGFVTFEGAAPSLSFPAARQLRVQRHGLDRYASHRGIP